MARSREQMANTESVDNYLKAIFHLSEGGKQRVLSGQLAERLEVSFGQVNKLLTKARKMLRVCLEREENEP